MTILALDPATQMGWAAHNGKSWKSGTISFHNKQWDGAGMRYLKFRQWLLEYNDVEAVFYEAVERHGKHDGTYAAHVYGGFIAVLQEFCEDKKIPYMGLAVGSIKKFWTGNGNAKKQMMIDECYKRKFNPKDDNEADALAIGHYGLHLFKDLV